MDAKIGGSGEALSVGDAVLRPVVRDGHLWSLGDVRVRGVPLRNPAARFLPWFDTYEGDTFRRFEFRGVSRRGGELVVHTQALSDPDAMFRERRDTSGDPCFRDASWDAPPQRAEFRIVFAPAAAEIDGRAFTGFKYWFEYESARLPIHRLLDRQTWEIGGNLDDVTLCLRHWLIPPRQRVRRGTEYSTALLVKQFGAMPGNMWSRWTVLPPFDMQYGAAGVLLAWFDRVSLIRTTVESQRGEDAIRILDLHLFEQAARVCTNPKTVLWCPDRLDDVDALNLWTRVQDQEQEKACRQFGMATEEPPAVVLAHNAWVNVRFDRTYERVIDVAGEFGADYVFIDSVWESQQAFRERLEADLDGQAGARDPIYRKFRHLNMCCTLVRNGVANRRSGRLPTKAPPFFTFEKRSSL